MCLLSRYERLVRTIGFKWYWTQLCTVILIYGLSTLKTRCHTCYSYMIIQCSMYVCILFAGYSTLLANALSPLETPPLSSPLALPLPWPRLWQWQLQFFNFLWHHMHHCGGAAPVAEWVRALDWRRSGTGFESRNLIRFRTLAIPFTPLCQCLSEKTLKACPFYLVSMPGEVKYPTSPHWNTCATCRGLHHPLAHVIMGHTGNKPSSSFISAGQRFQPHRCTSGGFRVGGGVHDSYTFQCGLVGSFTSPGIDTT